MTDICFDLCSTVSNVKDSTLVKTSRQLSRHRHNFFVSIYAAMRTVDDFVDENFLAKNAIDRSVAREGARSYIRGWLAQMNGDTGNVLDEFFVEAIGHTVHRSDINLDYFAHFAQSMTDDVDEREFCKWSDFINYCTGATISPTSIFVYMLSCRITRNSQISYHYDLPQDPDYYAADMAIFCYIVHILRDLALDALQSKRLITIPTDILSAASLTLEKLRMCVREKEYDKLLPLANILLEKANFYLERGRLRTTELYKFLGNDEKLALERLYKVYEVLKESFESDYSNYLSNSVEIQHETQEKVWNTIHQL
jgi:phytoene/squalene synthetase